MSQPHIPQVSPDTFGNKEEMKNPETVDQPINDEQDNVSPTNQSKQRLLDEKESTPDIEKGNIEIKNSIGEEMFAEAPEHVLRKHANKGSISNLLTFIVMLIGVGLYVNSKNEDGEPSTTSKYVLSMGLFGFAGGVTNWLAVKMLFDRIPFIIGSGVIPRQFRVIRETVKDTIMNTFFDPEYLESYLGSRAKGFLESVDIKTGIMKMLENQEVDDIIKEKLTEVAATPEGAVLNMAAGFMGGMDGLAKMIKPMLAGFGAELGPLISKHINLGDLVDIRSVRTEIDLLMTEKLKLLTPEIVKRLLERVIRDHLGWLIVWGNVFGALIGIISQAAGFGA